MIDIGMGEIRFPEYRTYLDARVEVNNAMIAILAGSRLAAHTLSLTIGSKLTLSKIFPAVDHIERFDLSSDAARNLLNNAEHHVASVSIPYALATHEDFVMSILELLKRNGRVLKLKGVVQKNGSVRAWAMHDVLFETCRLTAPNEYLEQFHVLREMRNCITHNGGVVDTKLKNEIARMGTGARDKWRKTNLGNEPEDVEKSGRLQLTAEHIFTSFAVTKQLGREINSALGAEFSSAEWAKIAVADFIVGSSKQKNSSQWFRSLKGYVRHSYGSCGISEQELEVEARKLAP